MIDPINLYTNTDLNAITKTAAVGPKIQSQEDKDKKERSVEELTAERDTVQNQLTTLKGTAEPDTESVKNLETRLQSLDTEITARSAGQEQQSALDRLRGRTDTYDKGDSQFVGGAEKNGADKPSPTGAATRSADGDSKLNASVETTVDAKSVSAAEASGVRSGGAADSAQKADKAPKRAATPATGAAADVQETAQTGNNSKVQAAPKSGVKTESAAKTKVTTSASGSSDDDTEDEIEELETERDNLQRQANAAQKRGDNDAWERLKDEIKTVQSQIQQKENSAYLNQHTSVSETL